MTIKKFNIEELQRNLKKAIRRNVAVLGLDLATKSGWCLITTNSVSLTINYGVIDTKSKNILDRFDEYIKELSKLIKKEYEIVIEDSYFGGNVVTLKFLAKLEGIAYCIAKLKKIKKQPIMINASSARKQVGAKGNFSKDEVALWIKDKLKIKIEDDNAADALILALVGLIV